MGGYRHVIGFAFHDINRLPTQPSGGRHFIDGIATPLFGNTMTADQPRHRVLTDHQGNGRSRLAACFGVHQHGIAGLTFATAYCDVSRPLDLAPVDTKVKTHLGIGCEHRSRVDKASAVARIIAEERKSAHVDRIAFKHDFLARGLVTFEQSVGNFRIRAAASFD